MRTIEAHHAVPARFDRQQFGILPPRLLRSEPSRSPRVCEMNNNDVLAGFLGTVWIVLVPTVDFEHCERRAGPGSALDGRETRRADWRGEKRPHRRGCRDQAADTSDNRTAADHDKSPGLIDVEGAEISLARGESAKAFVAPQCACAWTNISDMNCSSQAALFYFTFTSSTSNISVLFGGMGPLPLVP